MSEMVERVARAIVRARHRNCCQNRPIESFPISDHEMNEAQAAIEAMAVPTATMREAGGAPADTTWHLMINAALA